MTIGYIGLGAMGGALARHLAPHRDLLVYDIDAASAAAFAPLGARAAASLGELARASEVVLLCLPRSSDVGAVLFGPGGIAGDLRPGSLVIDQTSGIPAMTAGFARDLRARGVHFLDAPVSGGIPAARDRAVTIIASGPDAAWERGEAVLRRISGKVLRCGARVGDGQALKLLTNGIGACYRLATLELAALWRRFGLPLEALVPALNGGEGANFTSRNMLAGLVEGRRTTDFAMALMVKDLNGALDLGTQAGLAMPMTVTARGLMQGAIGLFGPAARLEDVVPLVERLSAVRLAKGAPEEEAKPAGLPDGLSPESLLSVVTRAAAACNVVSVLEAVRVGTRFGLEVEAMARVIEAGSAWCRIAGPLLASPRGSDPGPAADGAVREALEAASGLAAAAGLPFIMPGIALGRWRQGFA